MTPLPNDQFGEMLHRLNYSSFHCKLSAVSCEPSGLEDSRLEFADFGIQ
jgi:hypothetical protein